jgi:sugar/nucleoside kinase (ribokinase family)
MNNLEQIPKKYDILVVGEINPDLVLTGDVVPSFGQIEKMVEDATLTIGSSACIFACGAARLGLKVSFIGKVGDDEFGHFMREQLIRREVDVQGLVVDPRIKTGLSVILSHGSDRAILTYAGTIPELRYEEIDQEILARARHLHIGSYYLLKHLRPEIPILFSRARDLGLTISLDTNYDPSERWDGVQEIMGLIDVFLPNETEITAVAGVEGVEAALKKLANLDLIAAVKLGARGGAVQLKNKLIYAPALPVRLVDTTGAGDSFDAGFLYGYLNGWDLERNLALACICGSLSTRKAGGTSAQPTWEEAAGYL